MSMMMMNSDDIARASARLTSQPDETMDKEDSDDGETFGVAALEAQKKEEENKKKFMQTIWTQGGRE